MAAKLRSLAVTGALLALACLTDCSVFDASLLDEGAADAGDSGGGSGGSGGTGGSISDAQSDSPGDSSASCALRGPPPRPTTADGPDVPEIVFALRNITLDQSEDKWTDIGLDLDGRCSPEDGVECTPPANTPPEVDGLEGIDNSIGHNLLPLVDVVFNGGLQALVSDAQTGGNGVLIVRIRGYNGLENDPQVDVTLSQSVVGTPPLPNDSAPNLTITDAVGRLPNGELSPPPLWDGKDYFWVRSDTVAGNDLESPLNRDDNAYVSGRTLVVRMPDRVDITFSGVAVGVLVRLSETVVVIDMSADTLTVPRAVFAGRWSITDILNTAASIGICPGNPLFDVAFSVLEESADVRADPRPNESGLVCDAASIGVHVDGVRARLAGVANPIPRTDQCLDAGADAATDGGDASSDAAGDASSDAASDAMTGGD